MLTHICPGLLCILPARPFMYICPSLLFILPARPFMHVNIVGSRAQFLRPFSGQDVLMIDFTSWGHLLKI